MDELEVFPKAILFLEKIVKHSQTSADQFEGEFCLKLWRHSGPTSIHNT